MASLEKREFGTAYNQLERKVMFDKRDEHIGWVEVTSSNTLKLKESPFKRSYKNVVKKGYYVSDAKIDTEYYIKDTEDMPKNGECISIDVDGENEKIKKDSSGGYKRAIRYEVGNYHKVRLNLPKPDFTKDEFLYELRRSWNTEPEMNIGNILGLQIVSCPQSELGRGGLGSISANRNKSGSFSKGYRGRMKRIVKNYIADELRKGNNKNYKMEVLGNKKYNVKRNPNIKEYNYSKPLSSIHDFEKIKDKNLFNIPLIMENVDFNTGEKLAPHVVIHYQVSALVRTPRFEKVEKIREIIKDVLKEKTLYQLYALETASIGKIALAYARLNLYDKVDNSDIKDAVGRLTTWLEESTQSLKQERMIEKQIEDRTISQKRWENLQWSDKRVMNEILRKYEHTGKGWRNIYELDVDKSIPLLNCIVKLSNNNLILVRKNYTEVKPVFESKDEKDAYTKDD